MFKEDFANTIIPSHLPTSTPPTENHLTGLVTPALSNLTYSTENSLHIQSFLHVMRSRDLCLSPNKIAVQNFKHKTLHN